MSMIYTSVALAAPVQNSNVSINTSGFDAILSASPIVQLTLLILVCLSIVCWAVGIAKYREFTELATANKRFLSRFHKTKNLATLFEELDQFRRSGLARVFKAGYLELKESNDHTHGPEMVERELRKATDLEIEAMESRLTLLATTGSTGPFIGLFGTVWGIMASFHKIGQTGSASLAVVAPGISEALIATAIGLAAAIPAVVMYNNFLSRIRKEEVALNNFTTDFINIVKRAQGQ